MSLQRSKLKTISESRDPSAIDAIIETVAALRSKMESAADPGYGYGKPSAKPESAAGAKPKFSKKKA